MYNGGLIKIAECRVQPDYSDNELTVKSNMYNEDKEKEISFSNTVDTLEENKDSTNQEISLED